MKEHCVAQRKDSSTEGRRLEKRKGDGEFEKQNNKYYEKALWLFIVEKENTMIQFN